MNCPAWCGRAHEPGRGHFAHGPTVAGVELLFLQAESGPPTVRVAYLVRGVRMLLDLTPEVAADLADVISAVPPGRVEELAAALHRAHAALGGG